MNTIEKGLPVYDGKVGVSVGAGESVAVGTGEGVNVMGRNGVESRRGVARLLETLHAEIKMSRKKIKARFSFPYT